MKPIGLGVVGCGVIGNVHLRIAAASPAYALAAVCDVREGAAREARERHGAAAAYGSLTALLADQAVEAVVLALPAGDRAGMGEQVLRSGRHLLVEKPVAMNAGEVERMLAARGTRVAACCSSRFRGTASAAAAAAVVAGGALGTIRLVHVRAVGAAGGPPAAPPPPWRLSRARNGGGILVNWGCYDLDYVLGLTGWNLVPRAVLARTWTVPAAFAAHAAPGSDAETHVAAFVACDGGAAIAFERGEFMAAATEEAWRIVGDRASLRLTMTPGKARAVLLDEADPARGVVTRTVWEGDQDWDLLHGDPLEDLAAAIREGRAPRTGLEQALVVQRITDAIYASAASGRPAPVA